MSENQDDEMFISFSRAITQKAFSQESFSIHMIAESDMLKTNRPKKTLFSEAATKSHHFPVFRKTNRQNAPLYVARIANARIFSRLWYVANQQNMIISESLPQKYRNQISISEISNKIFAQNFTPLDGSYILSGHESTDNYFHWHIDCLSAILLSLDENPKAKILYEKLNRWQRASLSHLGIRDDMLAEMPNRAVAVSELLWASPLRRDQFLMNDIVCKVFSKIKESVSRSPGVTTSGAEKIYVARTDSKNRKLLNEDALIEKLSSIGYKILVPSQVSYEDQVMCFANAKNVVGLHGAGLTNIGFTPKECNLIEIFPDSYMNTGFYGMVQVTQNPYYFYSKSSTSGPIKANHQPDYWTIDIDDFIQEYKDIL
ncbi:glycosyltransferase family 61 protein [Humitalea sp. 24SJ18S-53]|uniref:glycosyltransferase family 61 protein n=1 Tax=Humitalea sp. 24SJ18S-53 TaxID=3422307 RepID=UPI003D678053